MSSKFLSKLAPQERLSLIEDLYKIQSGNCFICGKLIDKVLHKDQMDIDHIEAYSNDGIDDVRNFGLTHSSCNRSKQTKSLRVARVISVFNELRDNAKKENRSPNLNDVLGKYNGAMYEFNFVKEGNEIRYSLNNQNEVISVPLYKDELSGQEYFFIKAPIEYIYHDDKINPRGIGSNIQSLIEEFAQKRPQLHVSLGWLSTEKEKKIKIFDGQHKACAQILLGIRNIPVRVFLNPNEDLLITTNTNAGTTLRQVAFDKSVQRHLGNSLFVERVERYKKDKCLSEDNYDFSEKDLLEYYKGERKEVKKYILDSIRDSITHSVDNKIRDYVEFGGKSASKPLSYSAIEKTFYSFFLDQNIVETPFSQDTDENPRAIEKEQNIKLMNLIAEKILINKFDLNIGTFKIEDKIIKGEDIPEMHLIAFRMMKEEVLASWLKRIKDIVDQYYIYASLDYDKEKIFQNKFPVNLWNNIETYIVNLSKLPIWVNRDLANTVFGGKQKVSYWDHIFRTGKTPDGVLVVIQESVNIYNLLKK